MAALTRRERKVKDILLKELSRMENAGGGLSYVQKQRLEKRIDHEHIDEEIEKMRSQLKWARRSQRVLIPLAVLCVVIFAYSLAPNTAPEWSTLIALANGPIGAFGVWWSIRATERKMFIYEALRELSDADEEGVQLGRAVREADELIERVVRRELGEDALPKEKSTERHRQRVPSAPFAPKERAALDAGSKGVSLAEMQRRKEAGSTILDH